MDTCNKMGKYHQHVKQNKPDPKVYILYDPFMTLWKIKKKKQL